MSGLIDTGYVAQPGADFASTGPHLDVRVLKDGKYINPETIRSLLTRLKVGKERTPLWQQQGSTWKSAAPITSGFGPRVAPTAGASTYHPAQDYGLSAGTPLAWEGPGTFTPGKGYGTIQTTDPQGNPYEIRLLHTTGGKPTAITSAVSQQQQQPQTLPTGRNIYNINIQNKNKNETNTEDLLTNASAFLNNYTGRLNINPIVALQAAFNSGGDFMS